MRRAEAAAVLAVAVLSLVAGVTWLFGPFGLVGAGVVLAVVVLFVVDVAGGE